MTDSLRQAGRHDHKDAATDPRVPVLVCHCVAQQFRLCVALAAEILLMKFSRGIRSVCRGSKSVLHCAHIQCIVGKNGSVLWKNAPCRATPMVIATVVHLRVLSTVKSQGGLHMDSFALKKFRAC